MVGVITAERSQREGQREAWWWLHGDTYPQRDLLKRWGCRWSKKRRAWYYVGERLPDEVQALIDVNPPMAQDDNAPCSDAEAERILGVKLAPPVSANGSSPAAEPPADEAEHQPIWMQAATRTPSLRRSARRRQRRCQRCQRRRPAPASAR